MTTDLEPSEKACDAALSWFVKMQSPHVSAADRSAFELWLASDPRHKRAYAEAEGAWAMLGRSADLADEARALDRQLASVNAGGNVGAVVTKLTAAPRRVAMIAAAAAALVFAGAIALQIDTFRPGAFSTQTAQVRTIRLPDGSTVDLAPESRIKVDYSETVRHVTLAEGEAFFSVRKGDRRVFQVVASDAEIEVVGTKFNVHQGPVGVTVAVEKGEVKVRQDPRVEQALPPAEPIDPTLERRLKAGKQAIVVSDQGIEDVFEISPARAGAWRSGHLAYRNTPLGEVIADVNRYSKVPIIIAVEDLNDLRITAGFSTSDFDPMLDAIEGVLPVSVDRTRRDRITLRPKKAS